MLAFKWVLRVLPLLYMAAVFIQSSLPSNRFVELPNSFIDRNLKESLHLIEFAILHVLLVLAFLTRSRPFTPALNVACALFAALYGVSDEFHQSFYAYRSASWFDLVKDFTGISVSFYFVRGALFKGKFAWFAQLLGQVHVVTGNDKRRKNYDK